MRHGGEKIVSKNLVLILFEMFYIFLLFFCGTENLSLMLKEIHRLRVLG